MKLIALNKGLDKYGYADEMEWSQEGFNGHQKGIAIGEVKRVDFKEDLCEGDIIKNYLPSSDADKAKHLIEIIKDDSIVLVGINGTDYDKRSGSLIPTETLYLPYGIEGHSVYEPSVNFYNVNIGPEEINDIEIELCFVIDGLNHYIVIERHTSTSSIFGTVMEFLDDVEFAQENNFTGDDFLSIIEDIGAYPSADTDISNKAYYMDFYDEAGNTFRIDLTHPHNRLRNALVSMRLINIVTHMKIPKKESDNE